MSAAPTTSGGNSPDLSELTEAEREAYNACELGDMGPREYARFTDRSPGTVSNLLKRARKKIGGAD